MCGVFCFFLPRRNCSAIGFLQIKLFWFTFAPKCDSAPYKPVQGGINPNALFENTFHSPSDLFVSVWHCHPCACRTPFSQGLETFKWEVSEHSQAAAVGWGKWGFVCHLYSLWVSDQHFEEKVRKRFTPVIPVEPGYCEGIVGAEKEHHNTCRDRSMRSKADNYGAHYEVCSLI